eukprot:TRINITY_DN7064_c0_g1_i2.p2 TRINITY_DN7064_c0_g1~~TRINITY_DN7064_c0_g1_i2.p2  ORF type:complete len:118 (-),score=20.41 TRINITY_DN7064_c0_g1_i2:42-395(-)
MMQELRSATSKAERLSPEVGLTTEPNAIIIQGRRIERLEAEHRELKVQVNQLQEEIAQFAKPLNPLHPAPAIPPPANLAQDMNWREQPAKEPPSTPLESIKMTLLPNVSPANLQPHT